ncbi:MAG: hypothetical protein AAFR22_13605, partial [Chloroflexota bacterium]
LTIAFPALLVFFNLLFLNMANNTAMRLQQGIVMPLFIGVITALVVGIPAAILISIGSVAQLLGTILFLILLAWAFLGLAGLARMVGMRISRLNEREMNPFMEAITGAFVLSFSFAFPLVGWFVLLPVSMLIGLGVVTLAAVRPGHAQREEETVVGSPLDEIALP